MSGRRMILREEMWNIEGAFTIARGRRSVAEVVTIEIHQDNQRGRAECVPYRRYGETRESAVADIEKLRNSIEDGSLTREALQKILAPGAARNAVDCALWDLEAKLKGVPVWRLAGLPEPRPITTAFTISLGTPTEMGDSARRNAHRPLLKLKLGGENDIARVRAVRDAAPSSVIIVDANESWTPVMLAEYGGELAKLGVKLVEQPLPAGSDGVLDGLGRAVPVCADESVHDTSTLLEVARRYDFINIKLDKTGGLTEAIKMITAAKEMGVGIMVGCMVGTSLGMAPAFFLGPLAAYVDLDGPMLLIKDRDPGILYEHSVMHPPPSELWG
jgi:L-alanine-DL-glutamate epimerase-like enolase superfamily enzyme